MDTFVTKRNGAQNQPLLALMTLLIGIVCLAGCSSPVPAIIPSPLPAGPSKSVAISSSAPAPNIRFGRIDVSKGLSQSVVNCILQDRQGFVWVGTQDGLNRYDGYTFKIFRPASNDPQSINDRWINSLFQDKKGYIWIGTRQGGLNRYDPTTGLFLHFINDPTKPSSLISNQVQVVYEDSQGRFWVGTAGGLDRFVSASSGFEHFKLNTLPASESNSLKLQLSSEGSIDSITSIFEDKQGFLWVATASAGLNRYDEKNNAFINYSRLANNSSYLSSNSIRAIQEDANGNLWVATDKGINLLDPLTGLSTRFLHSPEDPGSLASNSVRVVYVDGIGNVWVGTSDGLDWYDHSSGNFVHYRNDPRLDTSLSNNIITAITESSDGVLWIGTSGGGLNKYYREQGQFKYFHFSVDDPNNLSGNIIRNITIDENSDVWIGTLDGGLDWLNPNTGLVTHILNNLPDSGRLDSNEIWSVYLDPAGTLWVGTSAGLDMLSPDSIRFVYHQHKTNDQVSLSGSPVYAILEDNAENLWVGTKYGLDQFDRNNKVFFHHQNDPGSLNSISGNEIKTLYMDRSGILWIGTLNDGLNRYDSTTSQFFRYQNNPDDPGSISSNAILSMYQDMQGALWVGTDGGGLNRLAAPASNSFTHYGEEAGLPSSVIYGILEDNRGYLWLSTNYGISHFDPATGRSVRNYTVDDGLQGNEFSPNASAKDRDGNLYFGGVNGLTVFDPGLISNSPFVPPVVLLSITQEGLPLNGDTAPDFLKAITLHWPQRSFEFGYSALSYAQPGRNQFAYMLENFDQAWNQVGTQREGRYTNLPGGNYVLRIKASSQDGIWNETGVSIRVTVVPAIWQTLWFRLSTAGCILILGMTVYWWRVRSIQSYNRDLERQVRDRTKEIEKLFERTKELAVVEERNRLARELHDSAKQKAFAALAQLGTANGILKKNPKAAKNHLVEAENLVYEVIEELTFLIQEMYPAALKEKGLATTLHEYVFEWEGRTDIQADVRINNERRLRLNLEQAIYRVIQEALSNVSRHSHATHVEVELSYMLDSVVAIVADNGCGFDNKARPSGVGLRSIRERIESLGGVVGIDSMPDCGTRLTVHLPILQMEQPVENRSKL
jgi:two-component system, sensor histidine kinase ChiS